MDPVKSERQKMLDAELYYPSDKELVAMRFDARKKMAEINAIDQSEVKRRASLFKALFGKTGKRIYIESNFNCDYGCNIEVGENFYANFGCVILDCAKVSFGDDCMLAPQVGIYAATHPIDPEQRKTGIEIARPVSFGNNCWIGGQAVINPGVSLGNNVVVASGAVVTKSYGDNVVLAGNPARVIRRIE